MSTPRPSGEPPGGDVWVVVGLGNPGAEYADTRHNVGHLALDVLAARAGGTFRSLKGRADVVDARPFDGGPRVVLARPRCYMNESGGPVAAVRDFFKVPPDRIAVVHDELDLPFGAIRLKLGGGDNGHNGLRSIRKALGTGDFHRVRVGIGRPPGRMDPAAYVLRGFAAAERKELDVHLERVADAVDSLVRHGLERAQNDFND